MQVELPIPHQDDLRPPSPLSSRSVSSGAEAQEPSTPKKKDKKILCRTLSGHVLEISFLSHQVAGQVPLLKLEGRVAKALIEREGEFYHRCTVATHPEFQEIIPKFHKVIDIESETLQTAMNEAQSDCMWRGSHKPGVSNWREKVVNSGTVYRFLVIENLLFPFKHPSVLDLKMGRRQYGLDATQAKIASMTQKASNTTTGTLGFRIAGVKVYQPQQRDYVQKNKDYGNSLNLATIQEALMQFFDNGYRVREKTILNFINKIQKLVKIFETQTTYKFFGTSLLLIYEGTNEGSEKCDLRMVDFAKTYETNDGTRDEDYLFGVTNLLKILQGIHKLAIATSPGQTI